MSQRGRRAKADPSRRGFFKALGGFGAGVIASWVAAHIPTISQSLSTQSHRRFIQKTIAPLLASGGNITKFHFGADHYLVAGVHSDNGMAGMSVVRELGRSMEIGEEDDPSKFELDPRSNWILVGAPSSSREARSVLGFGDDYTAGPRTSPGVRFTYEYEDRIVPLKRFTGSGDLQEMGKVAAIRDRKTGALYRAEAGEWLESDLLLITRLPVVSKPVALSRTVIGGVHGVGTRGIELLLHENQFSRRQKELLATASADAVVQVLARVDARTDENARLTSPTELTVLDVHVGTV